ncbi:hypothetical protein Ciccas_005383 [Cichlidogyrus casuarinus]|uniref:Uncharacterized protein n=1 Tax=Cichlidogyrus casuarinus TaxID=1844966 RepID=A0ABD2Q8T5_9PLAT
MISSSLVLQLVGAEALAELAASTERRTIEVKPEVLSQTDLLVGAACRTKKTCHKEMSQRETIGMKGGVAALVNLLRSANEQIVVQACKTLSVLCADVGYVSIPVNQFRVFSKPFGVKTEESSGKMAQSSATQHSVGYSGVRLLIALLLHAENKHIQCEAGHALAMALLGQSDLQRELMGEEGSKAEEIWDAILARLLYLLHTDLICADQATDQYDDDDESDHALAAKQRHFEEAIFLRLRAAEALTILAYEGTTQITKIGMLGGLRFRVLGEICRPDIFVKDRNLLNFMQSKIEPYQKCIAAFQVSC